MESATRTSDIKEIWLEPRIRGGYVACVTLGQRSGALSTLSQRSKMQLTSATLGLEIMVLATVGMASKVGIGLWFYYMAQYISGVENSMIHRRLAV